MIARDLRIAIVLTVLAMILALASGYEVWYKVDGPSDSLYYFTFRTSVSDHSPNGVINVIVGIMWLWMVAGLLFVWTCLRESKTWPRILGLVLILAPVAAILFFVVAFPDSIQSHYSAEFDDFAGRTINDVGTGYICGPSIGWYLFAIAAVTQAIATLQFILPHGRLLKKKESGGPLGEQLENRLLKK